MFGSGSEFQYRLCLIQTQMLNRQSPILDIASETDFTRIAQAQVEVATAVGICTAVNGPLRMLTRVEAGDILVYSAR